MSIRVIVCGGRDYTDQTRVFNALNKVHEARVIALVIEGGADGADKSARLWAERNGVPVKTFRADWRKHGRAAGPIRNQLMLTWGVPDGVIAFPGGRGTANMVSLAEVAGVPVYAPYGTTQAARLPETSQRASGSPPEGAPHG